MKSVRESYFGWTELAHAPDCKRPSWDVDTKVTDDAYRPRSRYSTTPHSCADEECGHGPRYRRTEVRIVCRSCGHAHLVDTDDWRVTPTDTNFLGYGQQPRRVAGLLLWPGEPLSNFGMSVRDGQFMPYGLLVTGPGVTRPQREDLVGEIAQTLSPRGAVRYGAVRHLDPNGMYGAGEFRWTAAIEGLRSIPAAAKWIAAQSADTTTSNSATEDH